MIRAGEVLTRRWMLLSTRLLPIAESGDQPLTIARLLRLSLFQVSVGSAMVLLIGTLNRVLIVELGVHAWLVAVMVALPLLFAPFRALIGFRSDNHRSLLGWRRVPYIWMGSMLQFGGLAIMPFALLILSGDTHGPVLIGHIASALAFLLTGAGLQITQTAGLALATDVAPAHFRPQVIAMMYAMLLLGMLTSGLICGQLLANFSEVRLIQVVQGIALLTMALNIPALWKQEGRGATHSAEPKPRADFASCWRKFRAHERAPRFLLTVGLGTAAFNMQDIVLEPYGGEILHMSVGATTTLTALLAAGMLLAFALAARALFRGADQYRVAARGVLIGLLAFGAVLFAAPLHSAALFRAGVLLIGLGSGFFCVGTLAGAMSRERDGESGLALGAWGAVQALAAGLAIALGGSLRDVVTPLATQGALGEALMNPATGYSVVYQIEIALLFATLIVLGPLVRTTKPSDPPTSPPAHPRSAP